MRMSLIPKSLLARTAIVIVLALIAAQLVSVSLFRHYSREPRVQLGAIGFVGQLKTIRSALEFIPPEQQREFFQRMREERGMRIFRLREEEPMEIAPDIPALRVAREKMREEFGPGAEIFARARPQKPDAPPILITRLPVRDSALYVVFPRGRIVEQDYTWAWVGWGVFGGVLAAAGAMFLMWRVTRPLKALVGAAHELGSGINPAPVPEVGPIEVKSVAVAFNQMRDDLRRLDQERATFLAGVSHDLRTPLARLRLNVEMLSADEATRRDIERDIGDINSVIDQFMDFARDESVEPVEETDLSVIVNSVADRARRATTLMNAQAEGNPIAIRVNAGDHMRMPIRPLAMRRVVSNLIDNAIKHTNTDVDIALEANASNVILRVMDRGEGIAPKDVERLKQPFTRMDNSRAGASGAGLGLAIVERITRLHGGVFSLLPREGGGTEARVTLPRLPRHV
jgi:two-component system, OmpR family, osmolarity sensor histidine kinase EnvZ